MQTTGVVETKATVQDLLDAGLHFGHQTKRWNPKMKPFIFGERNGIYIIDLVKSLDRINQAKQFVYDCVVRGRQVLFVGTKKAARGPVREMAEAMGQPYVVNRWLGGMLTNSRTVRQSVRHMRELEKMEEENAFDSMNKKEVARLRRELAKLRQNLSGVADMEQLPAAMFVVDVNRDAIAVKEANLLHIPVIAMLDTNSDPDPVDYPIPGNDDAIRAIQLVTSILGEAVKQAGSEYSKIAAEEARRKAEEEAVEAARRKAAEEARKREEKSAAEARKAAIAKARKKREEEKKQATTEASAEKPAEEPKAEAAAEEKPAEEPKTEAPVEDAQTEAPTEEPKAEAPTEETPTEEPKVEEEAVEAPAEDEKAEDKTEDNSDTEKETKE